MKCSILIAVALALATPVAAAQQLSTRPATDNPSERGFDFRAAEASAAEIAAGKLAAVLLHYFVRGNFPLQAQAPIERGQPLGRQDDSNSAEKDGGPESVSTR